MKSCLGFIFCNRCPLALCGFRTCGWFLWIFLGPYTSNFSRSLWPPEFSCTLQIDRVSKICLSPSRFLAVSTLHCVPVPLEPISLNLTLFKSIQFNSIQFLCPRIVFVNSFFNSENVQTFSSPHN